MLDSRIVCIRAVVWVRRVILPLHAQLLPRMLPGWDRVSSLLLWVLAGHDCTWYYWPERQVVLARSSRRLRMTSPLVLASECIYYEGRIPGNAAFPAQEGIMHGKLRKDIQSILSMEHKRQLSDNLWPVSSWRALIEGFIFLRKPPVLRRARGHAISSFHTLQLRSANDTQVILDRR